MKIKWNFLGVRGSKTKNLPCDQEYRYFLELHNEIFEWYFPMTLYMYVCCGEEKQDFKI